MINGGRGAHDFCQICFFFKFSAVYLMRSKNQVSTYFKQYLADHRFSGTPAPP